MKPAFSVIFFTVMSGTGYGLIVWLSALGMIDPDRAVARIGYPLAFVMISAGLLSSTLHLKSPARARHALSQWRTSWLSREGVLALATFAPICLTLWGVFVNDVLWHAATVLAAIGALLTVYCTGMIYQSIRAVRAWATPLTSLAYLLAALAGGGVVAMALTTTVHGAADLVLIAVTALALLGLMAIKIQWWRNLASPGISTVGTATGLGDASDVSLFERPHVTENWLTEEMGFRVARKHAGRLRQMALGLMIVLPVLIQLMAGGIHLLAPLAALSFLLGAFVERWLFFAEARHSVSLYYGASHA
ncbi:MAG: dimethyl sulfoxide reductase anchor subunit [Minwuia sp.]|nr:dimethyl sulfoxide reductase anchor subunit [Minwuia sp.]